jgi:hypothetical protein
VPIAFEFEVVVAREHPHFRVHPTRGVVPANGAVPVAIEYTPQAHGTATIEVRHGMARHGVLRGSVAPSLAFRCGST